MEDNQRYQLMRLKRFAAGLQAGAPDWEVQYDVNFITTDTML